MQRALVVVDVQNDFCEGGSLAVSGGAEVATRISRHIKDHAQDYTHIVATADRKMSSSLRHVSLRGLYEGLR